ncbi:MAG: rRNA maturation RNase YbeY [Thermoflavifilum sp.]|nr:rRNA maturation RNase YbeY [Thermoflavifilum sp.]
MISQRIFFATHEVSNPLRSPLTKARVRQAICYLFQQEQQRFSRLLYVFCSDAYLLALNQQYLQHDTYTDILTFDLTTPPQLLEGEIYISILRVKENARKFGVPFPEELARVMFHGALHLCGYDDQDEKSRQLMRAKEEAYLAYLRGLLG